jgi:phage-related protein
VAGFVQENATWLVPLAAAIAAVVVAVKAWIIAQEILNVVMSLNPIGLVIIAIAALIAIIVVLVKNWDTVAKAAGVAWDFIKDKAAAAFNWIKANWPLIVAILTGPFGIAVALIVRNWDTITSALSGALSAMRGLWDGFVSFVYSIPGRIVAAFASVTGQLVSVGADWMHALARGIENAAGAVLEKAKSIASKAIGCSTPSDRRKRKPSTGRAVMADCPGISRWARTARRWRGGRGPSRAPPPGGTPRWQLHAQHLPRTADAADIAYGFRRLELMAGTR